MNYQIYKLAFQSAVHFGKQNLDEGEYACCADTIFSALCQEALRMGIDVIQTFYQYACDGKILLSDAFPYMNDVYFLPKPIKRIETTDKSGDSVLKKAYKKLKYIPIDKLDVYLRGDYDVLHAPDFGKFGHFEIKESVSIRGEEETQPYRIGLYYYNPDNGIYFIAGYEEYKAQKLLEELLENLTFSGIGGKRASGLGRFKFDFVEIPSDFLKRLEKTGNCYMTLSSALPREDELENALDGAEYLLCKKSGFVASDAYADEQMRKNDLYVFRAGSCFISRFSGDVYNVSSGRGRHPVYRYAKPIFMEVSA